jgi:hypothetical protein
VIRSAATSPGVVALETFYAPEAGADEAPAENGADPTNAATPMSASRGNLHRQRWRAATSW